MDCLFCKIANKEITSEMVFEDDIALAFNDINPKAPVHILIIPKKHIQSVNDLELEDREIMGHLFWVARNIAKEKGVSESGYRLSINVGRDAGQEVDHLHLHLLGGRKIPLA